MRVQPEIGIDIRSIPGLIIHAVMATDARL
jgi:hypothetical protein